MLGNLNGDNPWQSAIDKFQFSVMPRLKRDGKAIGLAAQSGDATCKSIINNYSLLHRSFDPMTLHLLCEDLAKLPNPFKGTQADGQPALAPSTNNEVTTK